jgi:energy-coupling factor transporter transmembrane protein EcfT
MSDNKKDEGGAAGILFFIILFAIAVYVIFRCSKLVYSYSRSLLLSIWTFLILSFLTFLTIAGYNHNTPVMFLALLWLVGTAPILFTTYSLYKIKKNEIDELIKEEQKIEQQIGNKSNTAAKLFTGAGALYAGYKLGHKTEL